MDATSCGAAVASIVPVLDERVRQLMGANHGRI